MRLSKQQAAVTSSWMNRSPSLPPSLPPFIPPPLSHYLHHLHQILRLIFRCGARPNKKIVMYKVVTKTVQQGNDAERPIEELDTSAGGRKSN